MTEKRFKLDDFDSDVEIWELLNTQAEIISDLEKENEQLKSEIDGPLTDEFCLSVPITSVLVDKSLLEEILNTLDSYDGLFVIIEKEYVQLDFEILIGKIKMVLK